MKQNVKNYLFYKGFTIGTSHLKYDWVKNKNPVIVLEILISGFMCELSLHGDEK